MPVIPTLPTVGGDVNAWGTKTNAALTAIYTELNSHEAAQDPHGDRAYTDANKLDKSHNLADVDDPVAARSNLGIGSAGTNQTTDFMTPAQVAAAITAALASSQLVNL